MIDSNNGEFIPVLTIDDIRLDQIEEVPEELPILPLRNSVLFPGVVIPITVGREKSIQLVKEYYKKRRGRIGNSSGTSSIWSRRMSSMVRTGMKSPLLESIISVIFIKSKKALESASRAFYEFDKHRLPITWYPSFRRTSCTCC